MTRSPLTTALLAASTLPPSGGEAPVPEWIHLLPLGEVGTADRRGPYLVTDAQSVIAASMADGRPLPIDENHALDLAAPRGEPAPARGWIVDMETRLTATARMAAQTAAADGPASSPSSSAADTASTTSSA